MRTLALLANDDDEDYDTFDVKLHLLALKLVEHDLIKIIVLCKKLINFERDYCFSRQIIV